LGQAVIELEGKSPKMAVGSVFAATVDHSTPLVLELNEITVLMAVNTVLIVMVIGLSLYVAASAFLKKGSQSISEDHFSRS
jgi:hypothetical protein